MSINTMRHLDPHPDSSPPPSLPTSLNILSHNVWGLKYIASLRRERLLEIGHRIASATPTPHIVCLQECWTQRDFLAIHDLTASVLPHAKFYHSGIFGGGLAILSAYPIIESSMFRYPLNGRPTAFFRGDWYVGKGVACASIQLPGSNGKRKGEIVDVFTTHLHAPYESEPNDSYLVHRTAQAWEVAKLLRAATQRGHLTLALGDFNMVPLSLAHQLIEAHAPVRDVWRVLHPDSSLGAASHPPEQVRGRPVPTARVNVEENGATCDSILNTWRWSKAMQKQLKRGERVEVSMEEQDPRAKRLDYIFYGGGWSMRWEVESVRIGMKERHPELGCSLSDHFSVEATLFCSPDSCGPRNEPSPATVPLPPDTYTHILSLISIYMARERRQRRLRLGNFIASIFVSLGCWTAIWWSPRPFVAFLLVVLSTLGFGAGVVDGLIGGLFMGSEIRALKEFAWEIRNAKRVAEEWEGEREEAEMGGGDETWGEVPVDRRNGEREKLGNAIQL